MKDEFNIVSQNKEPLEIASYSETKQVSDDHSVTEIAAYEETRSSSGAAANRKTSSSKTSLSSFSLLTTAMVAIIAVVAVISPTVLADSTEVNFVEFSVTDTAVYAYLLLENRSNNTLKIVVYNDFTSREQEIASPDSAGAADRTESYVDENGVAVQEFSFEELGLAPNMSYTLAVKNGTTVLAQKTFHTAIKYVTEFRSVTSECWCSKDRTFHFQMDFIDENNYFSEFQASLTDSEGNVSYCEFEGELTDSQRIWVLDETTGENILVGESATFTITCLSTQNNPEGEIITLYSETVEI